MRLTVVLFCSIALFGCSGGDEETEPVQPPRHGCAAGEWQREDGACIAAGLPLDMPCPPGEWQRDGACVVAGVPTDGCASGFVHDGDRGCDVILPPERCPPGFMAVPGATQCLEVAPCASGTWGDIPVEGDTEYVDASYAAMDSDGSALKPWTSIQAAIAAAAPGAIVAIASGSYAEDILVEDKAVRLWGVCPALVEVVGTGAEAAAVQVYSADASELRSLAVGGSGAGVLLSGSVDVRLERVWVHDNAGRGVNIQNDLGPTSVVLRDSLLERSHGIGLYLSGSEVTVEASVIRDALPGALGGRGIDAEVHTTTHTPSTLVLRTSLVEGNSQVAVFVHGSEATIDASVVRDTLADAAGVGRAVSLQEDPTMRTPATLLFQQSIVDASHETAVYVAGSQATMENSTVRGTLPTPEGVGGRGVSVEPALSTGAPSTFHLRTSLLEQNDEVGVLVGGSDATVEASAILYSGERGMSAQAAPSTGAPATLSVTNSLVEASQDDGIFVAGADATLEASIVRDMQGPEGRGLIAQVHPTGTRATLVVRSCLIERSYEVGVLVRGSEATLETSVVRDSQPNVNGDYGYGVAALDDPATLLAATVLLRGVLIEQSRTVGVLVNSAATLESCVIRDTVTQPTGLFGDGVFVISYPQSASAALYATRIERSARAAIASLGAHGTIDNSAFACQAIDFVTDRLEARVPDLEDRGGNLCGCPEPNETCKATSAALEPPPSLEP